jgi:hypothetical protein
MATELKTKESGTAGKPGESTAAAPSAASARTEPLKNFVPAAVTSLLGRNLAEPGKSAGAGDAPPGGEEVQPAGEGEDQRTAAQQEQERLQALADESGKTVEEIQAEEAAAANANGNELPEQLQAEFAQWEETGGELPPALQKLIEKRIGRFVGEREELTRQLDETKSEVTRLTGELETAQAAGPVPAPVGAIDEKELAKLETASEAFVTDAEAYLGDYADDAARARIEKHMTANGQDEKGLRRQLHDVNRWLTRTAPAQRKALETFRKQETANEPIVQCRFPTLSKAGTPEAKLAAEVLQLLPELRQRSPAHKFAQGLYAAGNIVWEHFLKANGGDPAKGGDLLAALRAALNKAVPLPAPGAKPSSNGNGTLPGRAPAKVPSGSPTKAPSVTRKDAETDEASETLRKNPTADNVQRSLKIALR